MNLLLSKLGIHNSLLDTTDVVKFTPAVIAIASMIGLYPVYYVVSASVMYIFDYKYIHINDWKFVCNISPLIDYSTIITANNHKCGYIASKTLSLFGYINVNNSSRYDEKLYGGGYSDSGYIFVSNKCLADHKLLDTKVEKIKTYEQTKHYCKVYKSTVNSYSANNIHVNNICWDKTPTAIQSTIISKITDQLQYSKTNNCVVLLSGTIGTGKSMLCRLLAESLNASIYDEYDLCEPVYFSFDGIINVVIKPTKEEPTVIVLEEIDTVITSFHNKVIEPKTYGSAPVRNKTDWNNFLDQFDYGQYPNVVLVMTTNKPRQWFDDLDPSYMREGRVNLHIDTDLVAADIALCNKDD